MNPRELAQELVVSIYSSISSEYSVEFADEVITEIRKCITPELDDDAINELLQEVSYQQFLDEISEHYSPDDEAEDFFANMLLMSKYE